MTTITWDGTTDRKYETGVDRGVLYLPTGGVYDQGFAWNGLTAVTEKPSGAEPTKLYADNMIYQNLLSVEEFMATVEAYTYPNEFAACDGSAEPSDGVYVGQQPRRPFGLSYRTLLGDPEQGTELGHKIHLAYGLLAAPSEKKYQTVNDTPEGVNFSWEVTSTPVAISGTNPVTGKAYKPSSIITIDSTKVDPADLAELEAKLYGTVGEDPMLPSPDEVLAIFSGALTLATPTEPTFDTETDTITIPSVTGVVYYNAANGVTYTSGDHVIAVDTLVKARPAAGYKFPAVVDNEWLFEFSA